MLGLEGHEANRTARARRRTNTFRAALCAVALQAAGARADDAATPAFALNGFGTLGLAHSSEHQADFNSNSLRPNGAGFTRAWSAGVDSLLGVQATATFSPRLSATLQLIAEQNYDNSIRPHVEWANLKYQFTPGFSARVGRTVLPVFLVSDSRKVGYANSMVRPPLEVYSLVPIGSSDGVDASYRIEAGAVTHALHASYGKTDPRLPGGGKAKAKDAWGIAYTAEIGYATLHASYHQADLTLASFKPLFDGFRQFGAEGIAIADRYDTNGRPFSFIGLGGTYDPGGWFLTGEWGFTDSRAVLGKRSGWYASGGYRLGKFTPYVAYARAKAESNTSDPGLTLTGLPPVPAATAAGLNAQLNSSLGSIPVQKSLSAGFRWDFAKGAALKLQVDHIRIGAGSPGTLINAQPGFQPGGRVNVVSATVDFVF